MERIIHILLLIIAITFTACTGNNKDAVKPNILFISIDDLRPELNCYGESYIKSPNMDKLAAEGLTFTRAYCTVPVCGASRASLFSGLYPDINRFVNYDARVDKDAPGIKTIPEFFKEKGYKTLSVGKTFHFPADNAHAWSEQPWRPDYPIKNDLDVQVYWRDYQHPKNKWTKDENYPSGAWGPAWEKADVHDTVYQDGKIAQKAVETLERLAESNEPFFLGLGFIKPHLPFCAPQKYWDLYAADEITPASNPHMPKDAPALAWIDSPELRAYANIPEAGTPINEEQAFHLKHGYAACISYIDAQLGLVLNKLEDLGLAENTLVVIWGDHGYSLGEHKLWGKISNFDDAMRASLIVKAPGLTNGKITESLISFVDVYPTLCDYAGLEKPAHLDGKSFLKVIENPASSVNNYVFGKWIGGESIITPDLIYTKYFNQKNGAVISEMLYDHRTDPDENINVVQNPEYKNKINHLSGILIKHRETRSR